MTHTHQRTRPFARSQARIALAFALATVFAVAARAQSERVEPWVGEMGVAETVDEIMRRDRLLKPWDPTQGLRRGEDREEEGEPEVDRTQLPQDPNAPAVSSWPPSHTPVRPTPPGAHGGPLTAPQAVSTSYLAMAIANSGFIPPDTCGAVGPTQILTCANGRIRVHDKSGVLGPLNTTTENFFTSVSNGAGASDPQVKYDPISQRWIVTIINLTSTNNRIMLAVSSGPTITGSGSFTFFFFQQNLVAPAGNTNQFADYPKTGVDANAIYIGCNMFTASYQGTSAWVVRKSSVLGAGPIIVTAFRGLASAGGNGPYSPMGVDNDDPAATEGYIVGVDNATFSRIVVRRVSNPGGTPTISGNLNITVPTTVNPQNQPALGTTGSLDPLDDRLFHVMMHRNRLTGVRSLWTAHNIEVNSSGVGSGSGSRNGSRWYEIGNLTTTPSLIQSGTLFDNAASNPRGYWIPSIAMSGQGHAALGTSFAGTNERVGIAVAGRLSGDTLGTTQAPTLAITSSTAYDVEGGGAQRWGDYSVVMVDPTDDQTMWAFAEYCNANDSWGVRVIKLLAPPPATPASCVPANVTQGVSNVNVVLTGTASAGSGFYDTEPGINRIAATVNGGGVTVNSIAFTDPTHITLNLTVSLGAATGARTITVTNPDGQTASSISGVLTIDSNSCISFSQQPSNATACVGSPAGFSIAVSGASLPTYQWRKNASNLSDGGTISGALTPTLSISSVVSGDAGNYDCVVTDPCGTSTSATASLTVNVPVSITGHPSPQTVCVGSPASFSVTATGTPAPTFQWRRNGSNVSNGGGVSGATTATLSINSVALVQLGSYDCVVTNACGPATSNAAALAQNLADTDGDGTPNCTDGCPNDPAKTTPGVCGCGTPDTDSDGDGTPNCIDGCPNDPAKTAPGACGCGVSDIDSDIDGFPDCLDNCDLVDNQLQEDADFDGVGDACDNCVAIPNAGQQDCDNDSVGDACELAQGAPDCNSNAVPDACDIALGTSQDTNANGMPDECEVPAGAPFCFGDGSLATPCPCAPPDSVPSPSGAAGRGCANSFDLNGAQLSAVGTTVPDTIRFTGEIGPSYLGFGFLVKGNAVNANGIANGDGVRCVDGALVRFGGHNAGTNGAPAGFWTFPNTAQTASVSASTLQGAGQLAEYQLIYRNTAPGFCSPGTTNWTNGLELAW
ncbi:MAG: immunoglobulin domain-containing protein [Planctomycetota bacterium]